MTETTIVGWDGSAPARAALEWAASWARGGDLTVARVLEDSIGITDYIVDDSMVDAARAALENAVAELRLAHPDLHVDSEFVRGDPIGELRHRSGPGRLVVVGTHRREGSRLRFEWSVGARLAASAHGPVAIVPEDDGTQRSGVVVGVDGSAASDVAVAYAAEQADRIRQPLRIIHAWQEPPVWQGTDALDGLPSQEFLGSLEETHRQILDEAVTKAAGARPGIQVRGTLAHGAPQPALLEASRGAALLVVGNHGLRGVERLLLGSVSHSIVLNIVSPTVVIGAATTN